MVGLPVGKMPSDLDAIKFSPFKVHISYQRDFMKEIALIMAIVHNIKFPPRDSAGALTPGPGLDQVICSTVVTKQLTQF